MASHKKSLKIPKGYLWTYNTMANKKRTRGQTMIYQTLHRKLRLSNANPTKNRGEHYTIDDF